MEHIATLKHYKKLIEAGYTDEQAEATVNALNESFDGFATKNDLNTLEKDLKIFFGYLLGSTLVAGILLPLILKFISG